MTSVTGSESVGASTYESSGMAASHSATAASFGEGDVLAAGEASVSSDESMSAMPN